MANLETLQLHQRDGYAIVELHRPARMNAWTVEMGLEFFTLIAQLDRDDNVRAIVVTGAGKAFCAGADLSDGPDTFGEDNRWEKTARAEEAVSPWKMATPIIGAINGAAVGIGATLPLSWDIRLASEKARIGFVFTRRGISPEANSTWLLPRLIGMSKAMEVLLTGRLLSATEALDYGIVSRVVPHEELLPAACAIAEEIATNTAPVSIAATRQLLWRQIQEWDPVVAKSREDRVFFWIGRQPDATEGVESFLEKRAPQWSMSATDDLPDWIGE